MAEDTPALASGVARDLRRLRFSWRGAYTITVHRGGIWRAARADNHERIEAMSAEELRLLIHADYKRQRVARP